MTVLAEIIKNAVEKQGEKTFFIDREHYKRSEVSYNEFLRRSNAICGMFSKEKIKKGDKIIIYLPNSSHYSSILAACAMSGVIAVPIDFNSHVDFVEKIYGIIKAKAIFCSLFRSPEEGKKSYLEEIEKIYDKYEGFESKVKIDEEDIFEIVYTSGTTSDPKGVVIKNKNIVANIESLNKALDFDISYYVLLSILPLSHLFEQNIGLFWPMHYGAKVVYISSRKPSSLMGAIREENVTGVISVPLFLQSIKEKIEMKAKETGKLESLKKALQNFANAPLWIKKIIFKKIRKNLGKMELFVSGGAALDIEVEKFWRAVGINVLQGYGLSESSPVLTCNTLKNNKVGTVGRPIPGVEVKIKDGEIIAKGKNVFDGYYENSKASKEVIKDGWLHTGDIGEFDSDGYLKITGRKKNMILSPSGLNVYPEDIESVMNKIPGIKDSVVIGLNNGKKLVGVVLLKEKKNADEIMKIVNDKVSAHQTLSDVIVWHDKDFPRTPTMKIIRRKVEEGLKLGKEKEEITHDKLINLVSEICEISPKKINEESILVEIGLDSLRRIDLAIRIEELFNVDFNEDDITEITKIKDLRELIRNVKENNVKSGINILNSRWFNPVRFVLQYLLFGFTRLVGKVEVKGIENIPKGEAMFVANHVSPIDSIMLFKGLPFRERFNTFPLAAQDVMFRNSARWMGVLSRLSFNAFAFYREKNVKQGLKDVGSLLSKGEKVLIYPEGAFTIDGNIKHFKTGVGLLAWHMDVPVVPVRIKGLYELWPRDRIIPKLFGKVEIVFGKPIKIDKMKSFIQLSKEIENEVREL